MLIVRNGSGIDSMKDLKGKRVATPFVSTSLYQLMVGLKLEGVDIKSVNVMNTRPPGSAVTSTTPSSGTTSSRRSRATARPSPAPAASADAVTPPSTAWS